MTPVARNILSQTLANRGTDDHRFHGTRLKTLLDFVEAGIEEELLTLTALGRGVAGDASEKHRIKRADRLLGNEQLYCESRMYYQRLARQLIGKNSEPTLLVDWSTIRDGVWHLLRVSMALQGRAVTVYEEVFPEKLYNSNKAHQLFLKHLKSVLPEGCCPIIVSDAGFKNPWFRLVEAMGWHYLGRVRGNTQIRPEGEMEWESSAHVRQQTRSGFGYDFGAMELAKTDSLVCQMVIINNPPKGTQAKNKDGSKKQSSASKKAAKSAKDPWMLVTNKTTLSLRQRYHLYYLRMQIEENFRDDKSGHLGMGLEHSASDSQCRLSNLVLIASLINFALTMAGICAEAEGLHRRFQANTVTTRRVLSFFYLGRRVVKRARDFLPSFGSIMTAFQALTTKVNAAVFA